MRVSDLHVVTPDAAHRLRDLRAEVQSASAASKDGETVTLSRCAALQIVMLVDEILGVGW